MASMPVFSDAVFDIARRQFEAVADHLRDTKRRTRQDLLSNVETNS